MNEIRWAARARRDLEDIDIYYSQIDKDLADIVLCRIVRAATVLTDLPYAGPSLSGGPRRKWRVPQTPYIMHYRIERGAVRILRVIHAARRDALS